MNNANKPPEDFTNCPHWGMGGRYIVGADGKRVPAPETPAAAADPVPAAAAAAAVAAVEPQHPPIMKGKRNA